MPDYFMSRCLRFLRYAATPVCLLDDVALSSSFADCRLMPPDFERHAAFDDATPMLMMFLYFMILLPPRFTRCAASA